MDKNDLYKPINKIFCAKHMQRDTQFRETKIFLCNAAPL